MAHVRHNNLSFTRQREREEKDYRAAWRIYGLSHTIMVKAKYTLVTNKLLKGFYIIFDNSDKIWSKYHLCFEIST